MLTHALENRQFKSMKCLLSFWDAEEAQGWMQNAEENISINVPFKGPIPTERIHSQKSQPSSAGKAPTTCNDLTIPSAMRCLAFANLTGVQVIQGEGLRIYIGL